MQINSCGVHSKCEWYNQVSRKHFYSVHLKTGQQGLKREGRWLTPIAIHQYWDFLTKSTSEWSAECKAVSTIYYNTFPASLTFMGYDKNWATTYIPRVTNIHSWVVVSLREICF